MAKRIGDLSATSTLNDTDIFEKERTAFGASEYVTRATLRAAAGLYNGQFPFPAVQNPSSDANTLDDYEEGSWTPVIGGSGGTSGQAYSIQRGLYLKIGQLVWAGFELTLSNKGTITANVQIQGFTFAANTAQGNYFSVPYWNTLGTAVVAITGYLQASTSVLTLYKITAANVSSDASVMVTADITNTTSLAGVTCYRTTA